MAHYESQRPRGPEIYLRGLRSCSEKLSCSQLLQSYLQPAEEVQGQQVQLQVGQGMATGVRPRAELLKNALVELTFLQLNFPAVCSPQPEKRARMGLGHGPGGLCRFGSRTM